MISDLFVPFEDTLQLLSAPRLNEPPLIEWRVAGGDFYFRPQGADPRLLWCDLSYMVTATRPLPKQRVTTLTKGVSRAFKGRTFFRVVPFADGDDWLLIRPKRALVRSSHQPTGAMWKWNCSFKAKQTQLEWLSQEPSWFEEYLKECEGDLTLRMARDCAALPLEQRAWNPTASNEAARWEQLMRALSILVTPASVLAIRWNLSRINECEGPVNIRCTSWVKDRSNARFQVPAVASKLRSLLQTEIRLPFWRSLDAQGQRGRDVFPSWQFDSITQHERLEAILVWRDFGRAIGQNEIVEKALEELIDSSPT